MTTYILAITIIALILVFWVVVQHLARLFAARHPQFGPYREAGGCGTCGCGAKSCTKDGDGN